MQFVQVFVDIAHVFRGERFLFFLLLEIFTFRREKIVHPMAVKGWGSILPANCEYST